MGLVTLLFIFRSFIASIFKFLNKQHWLNLRGLCYQNKIVYRNENNVNDEKFLDRLEQYDLDLIISFSAPTVFKDRLLGLPRYGCINLHCSALPSYAGVLPSFWTLFYGEKQAGISVHLMDSKIDNGAVLKQKTIDISSIDNMFDVILVTKLCGGQAMLDVISYIYKYQKLPVPLDTSHNNHSYFSWPKINDIKQLRAKGKKLI